MTDRRPRQTRGRAPRPRASTVFRLTEILRGVLGAAAGFDDDLRTLDRDPVLITRIHHGILESFGVSLPLDPLFEAPTLTQLAELVEQTMDSATRS
ncbi:phosphopantetheine-binding protein [Nonomuraea sp. NPDC049158]|uniref:phosphopantetheine-binding protein n=1 Tax=Nonomuraea sp. NPDC049158 TaxID=3155649 RepID=UPI0033C8507C